jgi:hypothetical protein
MVAGFRLECMAGFVGIRSECFWAGSDFRWVMIAYFGICSGSSYHPGSYCGVNTKGACRRLF